MHIKGMGHPDVSANAIEGYVPRFTRSVNMRVRSNTHRNSVLQKYHGYWTSPALE